MEGSQEEYSESEIENKRDRNMRYAEMLLRSYRERSEEDREISLDEYL